MTPRRRVLVTLAATALAGVASAVAPAASRGQVDCPPPGPRASGPLPGIPTVIVCGGGPDAVLVTRRGRVRLGPPTSGWQFELPLDGVPRAMSFERLLCEPRVVRVRLRERVTVVIAPGYRPVRPTVAYPSWSRSLEWRSTVGVNRHLQATLRVRRYGDAQIDVPWMNPAGPTADPLFGTRLAANGGGSWRLRFAPVR